MAVQTKTITVSTNGYSDVVDLTNKVEEILVEQDINTGIVSLFIPGSTAGLTTIEYEPGCVQDMRGFSPSQISMLIMLVGGMVMDFLICELLFSVLHYRFLLGVNI